jgi:hypothetical protein
MLRSKFTSLCQRVSAMFIAPTQTQVQGMLLLLGVALIAGGLSHDVLAQAGNYDDIGEFDDQRVGQAIDRIFAYIEGSFGALIMIVAGLGAIMAAALGSYSAALGLLVVAVGAFILRSLVATFFNTESINA